ncbi:MAG: BON domain-containing protein [Chloroflexi bacterium]|nr:BON domain-containing protein [Chloroflexota bacterium]
MVAQPLGFPEALDTDTIEVVPFGLPTDPIADEPDLPEVDTAGLSDDDAELLYRVRNAIIRYTPIPASRSRIALALRDGTIVLRGRTRTTPMKIVAERLAQAAAEGRPLVSELISDEDLAIAVASALADDPRTNAAPLRLTCFLGTVRLWGPAPSAAVAEAAAEVARAVPGVVHVTNELVVGGPAPSEAAQTAAVGAATPPTTTQTPPPRPPMPST